MKSSELKPLLLRNLKELFEIDPSPKAWGKVESLANNTKGTTKDNVIRMIEHLHHDGLINLSDSAIGQCVSINEKGIAWLKEHDESQDKESLKSWLVKPLVVAMLTTLFTVPVTIYVTQVLSKQICQQQKEVKSTGVNE